jgi:hypothetical protein
MSNRLLSKTNEPSEGAAASAIEVPPFLPSVLVHRAAVLRPLAGTVRSHRHLPAKRQGLAAAAPPERAHMCPNADREVFFIGAASAISGLDGNGSREKAGFSWSCSWARLQKEIDFGAVRARERHLLPPRDPDRSGWFAERGRAASRTSVKSRHKDWCGPVGLAPV